MADEIVKFQGRGVELARVVEGLSVGEALAMNCIVSGGTMTGAAEAAGVSRKTLYEWLEPGRALYQAVTLWKQDLATTARTRLLMMTDLATRNILAALERGDARLAMTLVQKLGILSAPPIGTTHVEAVTRQVTVRSQEEESSRGVRVRAASFVEQWTKFDERKLGQRKLGERKGVVGGSGKKSLLTRSDYERGNGSAGGRVAGGGGEGGGAEDAGRAGGEHGAVGGDERGDRDGGGAGADGAAEVAQAPGRGAGDAAV